MTATSASLGDRNGWDLAKTVRLLAKGNATAIEWLRSPIIFTGDADLRNGLLSLAGATAERSAIGRHHLHVAVQQRLGPASLQRFFYVLRPVAAPRWLDTHPASAIPPMDLPALIEEGDVDRDVRTAVHDLIAEKSRTRELGAGTPPSVLEHFVSTQLERAAVYETTAPAHSPDPIQSVADDYVAALVG